MKVVLVFLSLLPSVAWAETSTYRVIVHPDNPVVELTVKEISDLFLKKTPSWQHGPMAQPVDLAAGSEVREAFSEDVHGRSVAKIERYWQRKIFSGETVAPGKLESDADVVAFIAGHPGAIGYVSREAPLTGVRVVDVVAPPRPITREVPRYSMTARQQRVEGTVVLRATIDADGKVTEVRVKQELPAGLTQEAIRALQLWTFTPATRNGEPVAWELDVPMSFELD